ncbi:MAG TPA: hypothetical protein VH643_12540 [Gemmataceae bacterium]|jgi:hypothetical protein
MAQKLLLLLILLCWVGRADGRPAQVIIIRHAEKPDEGNHLSLKGRERAAALVPYFQGRPEVLKYKTPVAIYAQGAKNEDSSHRPVETVKGLTRALKLEIIDKYTHDEYPKMVAEILATKEYDGRMVLICWEHKVIPDMAKEFGVKNAPGKWHGDIYDRTWVITFPPEGKPSFENLPQKLMFGDSAH